MKTEIIAPYSKLYGQEAEAISFILQGIIEPTLIKVKVGDRILILRDDEVKVTEEMKDIIKQTRRKEIIKW